VRSVVKLKLPGKAEKKKRGARKVVVNPQRCDHKLPRFLGEQKRAGKELRPEDRMKGEVI